MSGNNNNLFWVITGAVIVLAVFLLISSTNNNTASKIFDSFGGYFSERFTMNNESNENEEIPWEEEEVPEEEIPQIDLNQFVPAGWKVMDLVISNGVVYITANVNNFYGGGCQYDTRMINTNNYDVHIKDSKVAFYNSSTNELIMEHTLPFDRVLAQGEVIASFTSTGKDVGKTPHYLKFVPWSDN